jgi:predicted RND superfamily exporter protein
LLGERFQHPLRTQFDEGGDPLRLHQIRTSGSMVKTAIVTIIRFCTKYAYVTIAAAVLIAAAAGFYSWKHFSINTDVNTLISENLPWRQRELQFERSIQKR